MNRKEKIIISAILLFYTVFFGIVGFNPTLVGQTKNLALLLFIIINYDIFKMLTSKKYLLVNILTLAFAVTILYSAWFNEGRISDIAILSWNEKFKYADGVRFDHTVYLVVKIVAATMYVEYLNEKRNISLFIETLFCCFVIWGAFVNLDALINYHPDGDGYLIGNKFQVTYYNFYITILLVMIKYIRGNETKAIVWVVTFFFCLVCLRVHCMTSMIANLVLLMFFCVSKQHRQKIFSIKVFLISLFISSTILIFANQYILNNSLAEFFFVDILGRDLTLTSRTNIFLRIGDVIALSPIWGYGLGNFYTICEVIIQAPNAQNGIANLLIEIGVVGVVVFISLQVAILSTTYKNTLSYSIYAYMLVMVIISSVEIPFDLNYFVFSTFVMLRCSSFPKNLYYK